jgi:hypothetical protein
MGGVRLTYPQWTRLPRVEQRNTEPEFPAEDLSHEPPIRHHRADALPHLVAQSNALRGVYRVRVRRPNVSRGDLLAVTFAEPTRRGQADFQRKARLYQISQNLRRVLLWIFPRDCSAGGNRYEVLRSDATA